MDHWAQWVQLAGGAVSLLLSPAILHLVWRVGRYTAALEERLKHEIAEARRMAKHDAVNAIQPAVMKLGEQLERSRDESAEVCGRVAVIEKEMTWQVKKADDDHTAIVRRLDGLDGTARDLQRQIDQGQRGLAGV